MAQSKLENIVHLYDHTLFKEVQGRGRFHLGYRYSTLPLPTGQLPTTDPREYAQALNRTVAELREHTWISSEHIVADMGCGSGQDAAMLAQVTGAQVYGLDISPRQLNRGRRLKTTLGLDNLHFYHSDFVDTPFLDRVVHVAYFLESLSHEVRKNDALAETFRILAPMGMFCCFDFFLTRAPKSVYEHEALANVRQGMELELAQSSEFLKALILIGYENINVMDITSHMYQSAQLAANWANHQLHLESPETQSSKLQKYWLGAIGLNQLIRSQVVKYKIFKAVRY